MHRPYRPEDSEFRWTDLAPQLHGARDRTVTNVLRLRRSPHHAHITMPGGLIVNICWSGIASKPYHLWVQRDRRDETCLAPDVPFVDWDGDREWMSTDIPKHRLPEVLEKIAGITAQEAQQATLRLHNQLSPADPSPYF